MLVLHYFFSMERKKAALNSLYIILFSQLCGLAVVLLNGSPVGGALPYLQAMAGAGIAGGLDRQHAAPAAVGPAGFSPVPLSDLRDSGCLCMELYEIFRPFKELADGQWWERKICNSAVSQTEGLTAASVRASAGFQYSIFNSAHGFPEANGTSRLRSKSKPGLLKADRRKQAEFF